MSKESFLREVMEATAKSQRQRLGIEEMPDRRILELATTILRCMPAGRLKALVERTSHSPDAAERHEAKEAAIVLFAKDQLQLLMINTPPEEAVAIGMTMLKRQREEEKR